ncbi:hypothetical protein CsSME_00037547 [Camellia sinensis var. sinensis]
MDGLHVIKNEEWWKSSMLHGRSWTDLIVGGSIRYTTAGQLTVFVLPGRRRQEKLGVQGVRKAEDISPPYNWRLLSIQPAVKRGKTEERDILSFSTKDLERVQMPHNDALAK